MSTEIVVQVRPDVSRAMRGEDQGSMTRDVVASIEDILDDGGATLVPVHPDPGDRDLGSFFRATVPTHDEGELIVRALRSLEGVEAAYIKPLATMP